MKTLFLEKKSNGVLSVQLSRPEVKNSFNEVMIEELTEVFTRVVFEEDIRLMVLRGAGGVFCSGGDLNWMKKSVDLSYEENLEDTKALTQLFRFMNECPKPLIGVVESAAIGGGVGLVSVCDYVIAEKKSVFSLSEVRLGIVPACIGPFVVAKVGASHARALFLSAERFDAKRAKKIGLIHDYCDGVEELESRLNELVTHMLQAGPQALQVAKKLVLNLSWPERRSALEDPYEYVAQILAELRIKPEGQEGIRAFLEKRKPNWTQLL